MAASSLIGELRDSINDESLRIQREFESTGDGRTSVSQRTRLIEDILARLWCDLVSPDEAKPANFCSRSHWRLRARLALSLLRYRSALSLRRSRNRASVQRSRSPFLSGTVGSAAKAQSCFPDSWRSATATTRITQNSPSLFSIVAALLAIATCFENSTTRSFRSS